MPPSKTRTRRTQRARAVPPPEPAIPVWTPAELAAYMATRRGLSHLEIRHDRGGPAVGTGRGCRCQPDQFLYTADWKLIAEIREGR